MSKKIICWWSGGITSAVACKIAIDLYGADNCRVIMLDTKAEHKDTYRFKKDCEKWYDLPIEILSAIPDTYENLEDTWRKHLSLNTANGAICSYKLKRRVREIWEKANEYKYQIFGFEMNLHECKRALAMKMNHPNAKPIFPLLMLGYDKPKCLEIIQEAGIEVPEAYKLGFSNNNCLGSNPDTGADYACVQGGVGYYQKLAKEHPKKLAYMASIEHELTNTKGQPVTMLKCQSNESKAKAKVKKYADLVFLKKHPDYPDHKCLDDMKGRPVEPLMECNGFCGTNDLNDKNETEQELAFL